MDQQSAPNGDTSRTQTVDYDKPERTAAVDEPAGPENSKDPLAAAASGPTQRDSRSRNEDDEVVIQEIRQLADEAQRSVSAQAERQGSEGLLTTTESVKDADTCPLCLHLLYEPVVSPCDHSFCHLCFARWGEINHRRQRHMALGDGGHHHLIGHPHETTVSCPICRRLVPRELPIDAEKVADLSSQYRRQYQARGAEVAEETARLARRQVLVKHLYVGNAHQLQLSDSALRGLSSNVHRWTFFVRMDSREDEEKFIDRVVVHLHPTFTPDRIVMHRAPFQVTRLGWGIFVIRAEVHFKRQWNKDPLVARWLLDFDGNGNMMEVELDFVQESPAPTDAATAATASSHAATAATAGPSNYVDLTAAGSSQPSDIDLTRAPSSRSEVDLTANSPVRATGRSRVPSSPSRAPARLSPSPPPERNMLDEINDTIDDNNHMNDEVDEPISEDSDERYRDWVLAMLSGDNVSDDTGDEMDYSDEDDLSDIADESIDEMDYGAGPEGHVDETSDDMQTDDVSLHDNDQ